MTRIYLALTIILAGCLFFTHLGSYPLQDVDEPRYAEAGREMLESGNYITPKFNYKNRFDKPILFYWEEAASYKIFGVNEFAARLPSALAGLGMVLLAFLLGNLHGIGITSALIMASSFEILAISRMSITDMTLCFCVSASIAFFYIGYYKRFRLKHQFAFKQKNSSNWFIAMFASMALGMLCKGPIAILLPGLVIAPFLWWQKDIKSFLLDSKKELIIGSILFLFLSVPWYLAIHYASAGEFTNEFFGHHNFDRYVKTVSSHSGPWWFYIATILVGFMPWTVFLAQALFNVIFKMEAYKPNEGKIHQTLMSFSLWWASIIFLFFSFANTKLVTYILPVYLPLTLILAKWWTAKLKIDSKKGEKNIDALIGLLSFVIIALVAVYFALTSFSKDLNEIGILDSIMPIVAILAILVSCTCIAMTAILQKPKVALSFFLSSIFISYMLTLHFLLVPAATMRQADLKNLVNKVSKDKPLIAYIVRKPSIVFYAQREVARFRTREFVKRMKIANETNEELYFIGKKTKLKTLSERSEKYEIQGELYKILDESGKYVLGTSLWSPPSPDPEQVISIEELDESQH